MPACLIENPDNQSRIPLYDRFRDRIIYPDSRQTEAASSPLVAGYSGDDKPKYLNSPETPVFQKGEELIRAIRGAQEHAQAGTHRHRGRAIWMSLPWPRTISPTAWPRSVPPPATSPPETTCLNWSRKWCFVSTGTTQAGKPPGARWNRYCR